MTSFLFLITRIQQRGVFSIPNANTLLNVREVDAQLREEMRTNGRSQGRGCTIMRCCSNRGEPGYNICTCKKNEKMSNIYSSE